MKQDRYVYGAKGARDSVQGILPVMSFARPYSSTARPKSFSPTMGFCAEETSVPIRRLFLRKQTPDSLTQLECSTDIPRDLSLSGFANNLCRSFLVNTYWASNDSIDDYAHTNRQWFVKCLTEDAAHPTSSLALEALAMAYFGRKHHQNHIVASSSALYGQALRALSQSIQDPLKLFSFDTLAAVTALSFFEYYALTT